MDTPDFIFAFSHFFLMSFTVIESKKYKEVLPVKIRPHPHPLQCKWRYMHYVTLKTALQKDLKLAHHVKNAYPDVIKHPSLLF